METVGLHSMFEMLCSDVLIIELLKSTVNFYRAMRMHSVGYAVARCPSVYLSVTCQYCV